MRILIKSRDGNNIHLYNHHEITHYDDKPWKEGLELNEWLDHSVEVSIPPKYDRHQRHMDKFRVGTVMTLPGGHDFIRDTDRVHTDDDYWIMTDSGLLIQLRIESGSTETGTILDIMRSSWMNQSWSMDYFRRSWKSLGGKKTLEPAVIHDINWSTNLLSEDSFPTVSFKLTTRATKMISLRDLKIESTKWRSIIQWRYKNPANAWQNFDDVLRLDTSDEWWRDGTVSNIEIRFVPTESQIHKLRDIHIHRKADYHLSPEWTFSSSLTFDGYYDGMDTTEPSNMYRSPFNYTGIGTLANLGQIKMDTIKFKVGSDLTAAGANGIFQDTEFDGNWIRASRESFQSHLSTIVPEAGATLPADGWIAGDNGSLFNLKGGQTAEVAVSDKKFNGTTRLSSVGGNSTLHITGDFRICDINEPNLCELPQIADKFPYSYNNFAVISLKTSTPVTNVSIRTRRDDTNFVPSGTVDCLRAKNETEWNTLMNNSMDIGDFFVHENDPDKLDEARKRTAHDITITFRKIPGYLFDVKYPTESTRYQSVDVISKYKVFNPTTGWEEKERITSFALQIYRSTPRWGLNEIPYDGKYGTEFGLGSLPRDDRGFAKLIAARTTDSWTEGILGRNYAEENWELGNRNAYTGKYGTFNVLGGDTTKPDVCNVAEEEWWIRSELKLRKIWTMNSDTHWSQDTDGGWDLRIEKLDLSQSYVSVVFFRQRAALPGPADPMGHFAHRVGINGNTDCTRDLDGNPISMNNFSMINCKDIPEDVWCISIGYLRGANQSSDKETWGSGMWRTDTWSQIHEGTDYKFGSCTANGGIGYNSHSVIYAGTKSRQIMKLAYPMFYKMEGSLGRNAITQFRDGFSPARISQRHPTVRGWVFDGKESGFDTPMRYTDIVNGNRSITEHEYNAGVLYESKIYGGGNQCKLEQSAPHTFNIPMATLKGGVTQADQWPRRVSGGQPGDAIDCFASKCTVNNQGSIIGNITNR